MFSQALLPNIERFLMTGPRWVNLKGECWWAAARRGGSAMQEPRPRQATRGDMATVPPHREQPKAEPRMEEVSKEMSSLKEVSKELKGD